MPANIQSIIKEINYYLQSNGCRPHEWFVGCSSDPLETMIVKHKVDEEKDLWIYRECLNTGDAKLVMSQLININKCDGTLPQHETEEKYVYTYKKTVQTTP